MRTYLLPAKPITSLDMDLSTDVGGRGIAQPQRLGPTAMIAAVADAGLRGRGGGGFPTGRGFFANTATHDMA